MQYYLSYAMILPVELTNHSQIMNLTTEVKFILQGGNPKDLKPRKDGRLSKELLNFLADNHIPY